MLGYHALLLLTSFLPFIFFLSFFLLLAMIVILPIFFFYKDLFLHARHDKSPALRCGVSSPHFRLLSEINYLVLTFMPTFGNESENWNPGSAYLVICKFQDGTSHRGPILGFTSSLQIH